MRPHKKKLNRNTSIKNDFLQQVSICIIKEDKDPNKNDEHQIRKLKKKED